MSDAEWKKYFSQLSNAELEQRLLELLNADKSKLEPLQGAVRAVEVVAVAKELQRRGVPLIRADGKPIKL